MQRGDTRLVTGRRLGMFGAAALVSTALCPLFFVATGWAGDRAKDFPGYAFELPLKESDALAVVKEVASDSIVRGTWVYEREKTLTGAAPAKTSDAFGQWQGPGQVFYKVLTGAVAPRHFSNSGDMGTISVRYVVQHVAEDRTRIRIDAVFIEEARRLTHRSDGSVEASEAKAIQDKAQELQLAQQNAEEHAQKAAADLKKREDEASAEAASQSQRQEEMTKLDVAESSIRNLEQRLHDLEHEAELRIRAANAPLKSAPFQKSTDLLSLGAGDEVVILIVTPTWYGVETHDGHRGWLRHDQAEPLP